MLDVKPQLFTYQDYSAFATFGMGMAWNRLSYVETPNDPEFAISSITLPSFSSLNFACDLGAGFTKQLSKHFWVSAEYLFTFLGAATPGIVSQTAQTVSAPPSFNPYSQTLLARLIWKY